MRPHLIALAFVLCGRALALDPDRAVTQYRADRWTPKEGLPQSSVESIAQTADGWLWFGTQEGLARFDGVRFTVFDRTNTPALDHNRIVALHAARDGSLWIGTEGGALVRHRRGAFHRMRSAERVRGFAEGADGTLYFGTSRGLFRIPPGAAGPERVAALGEGAVRDVAVAPDGTLWLATREGLKRLRAGRLESPEGAPVEPVFALALGKGEVWCATDTAVVRVGDTPRRHDVRGVRSLVVDRDGLLWAAALDGLHRIASGRDDLLPRGGALLRGVLNILFTDREGSLWVGVQDDGLLRLADSPFVPWGKPEGLSADIVSPILETRDGAIWIGTRGGGLNRVQGGKVTVVTPAELGSADVQALLEDREGTLWVGTREAGLVAMRGGRITSRLGPAQGLAGRSVRSLCEAPDGALWIGGFTGKLQRLERGTLTTFDAASGLPPHEVFHLQFARDGTLLACTNGGGLARWKEGRFHALGTKDGLSADIVNTVHEDADGTLWIGTYGGGLTRLRAGRLAPITSREGLFDDAVFRILDDEAGHLWISCNKGIYRVAKADLHAVADGKAKSVACTPFGTPDGMRNRECNGADQPVGWRTRDGRLFFPTIEGAVAVDPKRLRANPLPPPVVIEEVLANGVPAGAGSTPPVLGPGDLRLEIRYAALSFLVPERIRFRYRIEGDEGGWVEAGTRRSAFYTNVAPGEHVFRVAACNDAGVWNETGARFAFRVRPRFTQTVWFWLLVSGAVAAAAGGGYRVRVARLTAQKRALEALVAEKVRELSQAEAKIAALRDANPAKIENVSEWAAGLAAEISPVIGGARIGVFRLEGDAFRPLSAAALAPPPPAALREEDAKRSFPRSADAVWVPVLGMTGELRGVLSVEGPGAGASWSDTQRRVVLGFAQHLGGALELLDMRQRLTDAARERERARRSLAERGVKTVVVCPVCRACYEEDVVSCPADGTVLDRSRLLPALLLGRYRLSRLLGEGSMGVVFAARDEELEREVAVKVIRPDALSDSGGRLRVEREARAIARIRHSGVVALHDSQELEDGSACLVMELLRGLDLADVLHRFGPGSPRQVAELARQAGSALDAAHRAGILHRDVKPANVFLELTPGGMAVKVVDFGLALPEGGDKLTKSGMVVGTPLYMSPEQVQGLPLDARSDLFSLASLLFEALTGRAPFEGEETTRVWLKVLTDVPPLASSLRAGVTADVDQLFAVAFAKRRDERPAGVLEWTRRLAAALEAMPEDEGPRRWPEELGAPERLAPLSAPR